MSTVFVLEIKQSFKDIVLNEHIPEVFSTLESAVKSALEMYPKVTERKDYYTNVTYYGTHLDGEGTFTEVKIFECPVK